MLKRLRKSTRIFLMTKEGKVKIGRSVSTCYIEIERKEDKVIIGTSGTKFEVNAEDLRRVLTAEGEKSSI